VNVGLGDETMMSSLKFSTEREKEDEEACKLWKNIRAMQHSVEAAINGFSHAMLNLMMVLFYEEYIINNKNEGAFKDEGGQW